jgi:hypothetical protein
MSGVPLLLERSEPGWGPRVPLKAEYDCLIVEGLAPGCVVHVELGTSRVSVQTNEKIPIRRTIKDMIAQAKLEGIGSKVHVWLEASNAR